MSQASRGKGSINKPIRATSLTLTSDGSDSLRRQAMARLVNGPRQISDTCQRPGGAE